MGKTQTNVPLISVFPQVLFWVYFSTLGTLTVNIDTNISLVVIVILISLVLFARRSGESGDPSLLRIKSKSLIPIFILIGSQILSALAAGYDFSGRLLFFALTLGSFLVFILVDSEKAVRGFYLSAITLGVIGWPIELLGLNSYHFASGYGVNPLGWRWMGLQSHPNIAGVTMSLLFGLALIKYRSYAVAGLALMNIAVAEHRGGLIGAILILAYFSFVNFNRWSGLKKSIAFIGWISVLVTAPAALVARNGTDDLSTGRVTIWNLCLAEYDKSPLFGSGPNTITRLFGQDRFSAFTPFHCHNQFLDDLVNFGWIGALFPTALLITCLILSVRRKEHYLVACILVIMSCWFVETPFRLFATQPSAFLNLFILLAFVWAISSPKKDPKGSLALNYQRTVK